MELDALRQAINGATILIVPYAHCDWAWTYTREWHEERYALVFRDVLQIMREDPHFKWFMDTENEELAPFRARHPELMDELRKRVAEGRIGISGGTICDPHPHRIGGETFIRNMVMGREYFEQEFPGVDLSVLVLNDVIFGHSQLPQLAAKAGYRYYRAWRPGQALDEKGIPRQFRFRGLDGTQILTSRGIYGGTYHGFPADFADDWEGALGKLAGEIGDSLHLSPVKLGWWSHGMDDGRPLRDHTEKPVDLLRFSKLFNEREPGKLLFGTPRDYFAELEKHADEIPVVEGPLDPVGWSYWYGQIGSDSLRVWRVWDDEALVSAETWQTLGSLNGAAYPEADFRRLWRLLLKTCPHAVLWLFEDDYQELLGDAKAVHREAKALGKESIETKARQAASPGDGMRIVLFNDQSWSRDELVFMHMAFPARGTVDVEVAGRFGDSIRHQLLDLEPYEDGTLKEATVAVEAGVPPVGYSALAVGEVREHGEAPKPPEAADTFTVGSDRVALAFERGRFAAIEDGANGATYTAPDEIAYYAIEDTGPYHFGPIRGIMAASDMTARLVADGPLVAKVETEGKVGDHGLSQQIVLHKTSGLVDITTVIESVGGDGFFRTHFPLPYDGEFVADIPFGIEPRDVAKEPYGSLERKRPNVFYGSGWTAYGDAERGCALLIGSGTQGFAFDPGERVLSHTLLKTIVHPREGWERHETRVREGKGRHTFRYAFYPYAGDWKSERIHQLSLNWRRPVQVVKPKGPAGSGPTAHSWLSIEPDSLVLSALYREGGDFYLRFYETVGEAAEAAIELPFEPDEALAVDFMGNELARGVEVDGALVRLHVEPWEIVTLRLG